MTEQWHRTTPIYVLGDSHALAFTDLLWREGDAHWLTRACYGDQLRLDNFSQAGQLHPQVIQLLLAESLIAPTQTTGALAQLDAAVAAPEALCFKAIYRADSAFADYFRRGQTQQSPLVVMFGEIAGFSLGSAVQFPEEVLQSFGLSPAIVDGKPLLDWETALQLAHEWLTPVCEGLLVLKAMGFEALYLHSLPPLGSDNDLRVLLNTVLHSFCQQAGIFCLNPCLDVIQFGEERQMALQSISMLLHHREDVIPRIY